VLPPLTGAALKEQQEMLGRLRQLPKQMPSEVLVEKALRSRLFRPPKLDDSLKYPLVIYLHGGGPRREFDHLLEGGAPGFAYGIGRFVAPETQASHPCFVLAPWSGPQGWDTRNRRLLIDQIEKLLGKLPIDSTRVYITGQSMGGYGTWSMVTEHPEIFAAAIPICGGGDPSAASKAGAVAIWAFHGTADSLVPVEQTRGMVRALEKARGDIRYTEYDGGTHAGTAERAYCEPDLADWLFAQVKRSSEKRTGK
jgi:predicted peptidase